MPLRIHVSRKLPPRALERLYETGWDIFVGPEEIPSRARFLWAAGGAQGLLCLLTERVDAEVMDRCPDLKVISACSVGVDNIDLVEAERRGIMVCHTPGVLTETCAEFTMALMLALTRRLSEGDRSLRRGEFAGWGPLMLLGLDLAGSTLGIIGMGQIGQAVAQRAAAFGMRVLCWSRRPVAGWEQRESLEELLAESDVVSLHLPLTPQTHHLINAARLAQMKPGAYLVNTSRGPVVDEAALVAALERGSLAGAALDVFEGEPVVHPGLLASEKVLLTPHIASATLATREKMAGLAVDNLIAVLSGREPLHRIGS